MASRKLAAGIVVVLLVVLGAGIFASMIVGEVAPLPLDPPPIPDNLSQLQTLMRIYASSSGCSLPCFWGFRPGQTSVDTVAAFFPTPFDPVILERSHGVDYAFAPGGEPRYTTAFSIDFTVSDAGVLDLMEVYMFDLQDWLPTDTYELSHLLAAMGTPSEGYLSVRITAARVYLSLIYEDARTIITYTFRLGRERETAKAPIQLCYGPESSEALLLRLLADDKRPLRDAQRATTMRDSIIPVEALTGLDPEAFTRQIVAHPDECLDLLSTSEMVERGFRY